MNYQARLDEARVLAQEVCLQPNEGAVSATIVGSRNGLFQKALNKLSRRPQECFDLVEKLVKLWVEGRVPGKRVLRQAIFRYLPEVSEELYLVEKANPGKITLQLVGYTDGHNWVRPIIQVELLGGPTQHDEETVGAFLQLQEKVQELIRECQGKKTY